MQVTLSAGCASLACTGAGSSKELIDTADRRLYVAKREGKNRVVGAGPRLVSVRPPPEPTAAGVGPCDDGEPDSCVRPVSELALAFDALPGPLRAIVGLRFQENCGFAEIAAILELPEAEVRDLYARALTKLRGHAA